MTTAFLTHPDCLDHVTPDGHPEQVARLAAVEAALRDHPGLLRREAPLASREDVLRCHPAAHLDAITRTIPATGHVALDPDTHLAPGSLRAALRGVGGACAAVDLVLAGEATNAFVACRPPGHHAETARAMGFCLFGAVAIAARRALDHHGLQRVAIVDFDVHHGNGTQDLLWDEPRVLFTSSHQMPLYPGSGAPQERGAHGQIINVPLAAGSDGASMRAAYRAGILPRLDAFRPELVLISAGFDAHADDPLAGLEWVEEDFVWLTREIGAVAARHAGRRVVSVLEGGYDLAALGRSVAAHVSELQEQGA